MVDETTENQGGLFGRLLGNRRAKHEQAKAGTSGESGAGASPEDALGTQDDAARPGVHGSEPAQADAASGESEADAKVAAETDPAQLVAAEPAAGFDQS